jgi:hypothetical protein
MTDRRDREQPPQYPQQGYGQQYPQGQPWQPQQYDPRLHAQRMGYQQQPPWQQPGYSQQPPYPPQPQPPASRHPAALAGPTTRRLPPYPAHLMRFPSGMLPQSRRRRGHSLGHYVYMGTHPVSMLIALCVNAMIAYVVVCWLALVGAAWMMWAMLVTMAWLVQVAAVLPRGVRSSGRR